MLRWSKTGGTATTVTLAAHLPVDPKEHRPLTISSRYPLRRSSQGRRKAKVAVETKSNVQ
ncbi:hypothetical protein [Paenarthrobacter sp. YJN-5]|uniref:hypothetical protein n=1 Tax=Paenarthrobacter sp. YJN-5 TaxID=2735316 RepID=UPI001877734F|nr:hypothetical protein [Paenarthrobacter sp. YJN-5]QOT17254.1 hypothetical protein HMI59_11985 [Paenarthrobacter sp. YJN-5]